MKVGDVASALGKGLVAGAAGTVAMTGFQLALQKATGGSSSSVPAEAVEKTVGVEPSSEQGQERLTNLAHLGYGTAWGIPRALLTLAGMKAPAATGTHFLAVWGTGLSMLPGLKLAPPPTRWGAKELSMDAVQHLVYAVAVTAALTYLDQQSDQVHLTD